VLCILGAGLGLGANLVREDPLPLGGSLDPPAPPEPGATLPAASAEEALGWWEEGAFFLDVRAPEAFEERHVAGALRLAPEEFDRRYGETLGSLPEDVPLFVYGAGPDSFAVRRVAQRLLDYGHSRVGLAVCGLEALLGAGLGGAEGPEEVLP
jgi:rhodanese-related sulfurtransferase